jgi:rhamnosyltransferase
MRRHNSAAVAAVVVTHDPDERFARLMDALTPQVGAVWIVDNASSVPPQIRSGDQAGKVDRRVTLIVNPENSGLGAAQNQGITAALEAGYDWVLLMDHDSVPDPAMVSEMLSAARTYDAPEAIGFLVPGHDDDRGLATASVFTRGRCGLLRWGAVTDGDIEDRTAFAMSSGCLVPAARIREIGLMAEDFFIDYIDHDFSFRIRRAGYRIIVVGAARLHHQLGELRQGKFLGRAKSYREHPASRRYTIYRNRTRVIIRYGLRFPEFLQFEFLSVAKDLIQLLFWEAGKIAKLRAMIAGIGDGLMGRGGIRRD